LPLVDGDFSFIHLGDNADLYQLHFAGKKNITRIPQENKASRVIQIKHINQFHKANSTHPLIAPNVFALVLCCSVLSFSRGVLARQGARSFGSAHFKGEYKWRNKFQIL
jgi:hypothetical protein